MRFPARRAPDWRRKLELYIAAAADRPFGLGQHDCAMFAAGAVAAMTGADPAAPYRGRYGTLTEGLDLLRADGFGDHLDVAGGLFEEVPVARARPGDLAAVAAGDGDALGVVQGEHVYLVGPGGLRLVPLTDAARAWRVD